MTLRMLGVAASLLVACHPASPPTNASAPPPAPVPVAAPPAAPALDLVLTGGKVFTASDLTPWAEALAIRGDRIIAVGTTAEIRALPGITATTKIVELGGRVVIPGINDAHVHAPDVWDPTFVKVSAKTPGDPTVAEAAAALADAVKAHPPGTWLIVRMGNEWYDDPKATRAAFDKVAPAHPVMGNDQGGHAKLVNTAALTALGFSPTAADPPHGKLGRDPRTKQLTGWLHESASWRSLRKLEEAMSDAAIAQAIAHFEGRALRYGITSVQNMPMVNGERLARLLGTPKLRWRLIRWPYGEIPTAFAPGAAHPRVKTDGVKYVLDGTPLERWAGLSRPYKDRPKTRGQISFTTDEIRTMVEVAATTNEPLLLHAVGDATIEQILTALETHDWAKTGRWRERRVRIEHGDLFTPAQIERAAALGVIVVQNPIHFLIPEIMAKRFGDCGGTCQPLKSLARAGVPIALGSDGPLNPFLGIMAATVHPTSPGEALTREEAVIAYTRGAAYAERAETEKGALAPGMQADIAVLAQDIFTVPPDQLPATQAWMTIVGGEIAYAADAK